MECIVRGDDEQGPVELRGAMCWRCGALVVTDLVSMAEHVDRAHPLPEQRWHEGETPIEGPLPNLLAGYPGPPRL